MRETEERKGRGGFSTRGCERQWRMLGGERGREREGGGEGQGRFQHLGLTRKTIFFQR